MRRKSWFLLIFSVLLICTAGVYGERRDMIPHFTGEFKEYIVKAGQDLYPIARDHGYAIEHLMYANDLPGLSVNPGQKIIIPTRRIPPSVTVRNGIVLNLPERGIYLFKDGKIQKFYPVAIGQPGRWMTPRGDTRIENMTTHPTWFPPEWAGLEEPVPAGPDNPLGDRWMGLSLPGYGIHATNNPSSIGMAASHGCVRMYPEMARDLYDRVSVGTPVRIIYEPVKIGYDPERRQYYMEVYADIYELTPGLLQVAKKKLADANLSGLVDDGRLQRIISRKRGIPEVLIGSNIVVKIDGKRHSFSSPPLLIHDRVWVTSDTLESIGASLSWDAKARTITVARDGAKVTLNVCSSITDDPKIIGALLWKGKSLLPLGHVLKGLGVKFTFYRNEEVLYISSERLIRTTKPGKPTKDTSKPVEPTPTPSPTPEIPVEVTPTPEPTPEVTPSPVETPEDGSDSSPDTPDTPDTPDVTDLPGDHEDNDTDVPFNPEGVRDPDDISNIYPEHAQ